MITHTGRKSGKRYRTPANYTIVDDDIYCTAGFGGKSDWYRNMISNPQVEVWLPDGWWYGYAEEVTDSELYLPLLRQVLQASGFAAYAAGIDPYRVSDEGLAKVTEGYRLMRIRRTAACTGAGGPGDLVLFWPIMVMALVPLLVIVLLTRRKK